MEAVNRESRFLLIKYLLITVVLIAVVIILATLSMATFLGNSGSGYSIGMSVDPNVLSILGLQLLSTIVIAYFIGPLIVNSIKEGQNWAYAGIKSILICWATPWILTNLIATIPDLSWDIMLINGIVAIIPAVIIGPIVGRALKKKIIK